MPCVCGALGPWKVVAVTSSLSLTSGAIPDPFVADRATEDGRPCPVQVGRLRGVTASDVAAELVILRKVLSQFGATLSEKTEAPCRFFYTRMDGRKVERADRLLSIDPNGTLKFVYSPARNLSRIDRLERLGVVDGGRPEYLPVVDRNHDLPITDPWTELAKYSHQPLLLKFRWRDSGSGDDQPVQIIGRFRGRTERPGCLKFVAELDRSVTFLDPRRHEIVEVHSLGKVSRWVRGQSTTTLAERFPPGSLIKLSVVSNRGFTRAEQVEGYVRSYTTGHKVSELVIVESEVEAPSVFHGVYLHEIQEVVSAHGSPGAHVPLKVLFSRSAL